MSVNNTFVPTFSKSVCEDCTQDPVLAIAEYVLGIDANSWEGNQEGFETALLLLLSRDFGTDPKLLASLTGSSLGFVQTFASRARAVGLWVGEKVVCEHWEQNCGKFAFFCDVLVAQGILERRKNEAGTYAYRSNRQ
jgi:hypothetical protein